METLLAITLFGSIFWGIAILVILTGFLFWADHEQSGFLAAILFVTVGSMFYFFGKETFAIFVSLLTFINLAIYFGIGLVYAFVRIFFYGRNEMIEFNKRRLGGASYEFNIDRDIKGNVFRWWFMWPISLINWFVKDLVKDIYNFVYQKLERIFNAILELGIKSVKEVPKPVKEVPKTKS